LYSQLLYFQGLQDFLIGFRHILFCLCRCQSLFELSLLKKPDAHFHAVIRDMNISVHRHFHAGMAEELLQGLGLHPAFDGAGGVGMPIGYNKDKSGIPVFSRGCGFVLALFPLKNPSKMGAKQGGDKRSFHIKDKFPRYKKD